MKQITLFLLSLATICSYAQEGREAKRKAARETHERAAIENAARTRSQISDLIAKGSKMENTEGYKYGLSQKLHLPCAIPSAQTTKEISSIPPQGIIISEAGIYRFTKDISWTPTGCTAITIEADGVTLDLNGKSLIVVDTAINAIFRGIDVSSRKNTVIKNGSIAGISLYGVSATNATGLTIENLAINGMRSYEVSIVNFTPTGIFLDTVDTFSVTKVSVEDANVTTASYAGIQILNSKNGTVTGCSVNNVINNDGGAQGFSYISSSKIKTTSCSASNFQTLYKGMTNTTGHTSIGFVPIFCTNLEYDACTATNIKGCCDDAHGMSVFLDSDIVVNNFTAKNIEDGNFITGAKATGLEVYGLDIVIKNSTVDGIISYVPQDFQSTGFSACGVGIKFDNCVAKNVVVKNIQGQPDTTKGFGTGFGWAPDPRYPFRSIPASMVTYSNCTAENCQLGFDTWYHQLSSWLNNTAIGCDKPIVFEPESQRTLSMDKCSESPGGDPFWVQLTNKTDLQTLPTIKVKF